MKRNETAAHHLHAAVVILLDVNRNRGRADEKEKLGKAEAHLKRADKILDAIATEKLSNQPEGGASTEGALIPTP